MKMMNKEEKKELIKQIDKETKIISHPTTVYETVDFIARGFPKNSFLIWKQDCIKMYNDIYWAKIWSDHLKAQAHDSLVKSYEILVRSYDFLINNSVQTTEPEEEEKIDENANIPLTGDGGTGNG